MPTSNSCECPYPPGGRVECHPDDAAACYVDGLGQAIGKCIRINRMELLYLDKEQRRLSISQELGRAFNVFPFMLETARWVYQSDYDGFLVSIQMSEGSINVKFPHEIHF